MSKDCTDVPSRPVVVHTRQVDLSQVEELDTLPSYNNNDDDSDDDDDVGEENINATTTTTDQQVL
eukprot:CAMPEP_0170965900 /NCGR_PEP_ID=MMETSP0735-20130129/41263_1 /TAXON_ID=186038 /ORGANISM="Fragilariopsis kerguelensis, Strain L26-C5" /LENGTH=64 /DNA_ID=CAMNT_0011383477 /DNA_START=57 /DNA_END=247 /DNA_ORIENTATION=+